MGDDGGIQGHVQVQLLAQRAARELLEDEIQSGELLGPDVDAALRRAEGRLRDDASKWLRDARGETKRMSTQIQQLPAKVKNELAERLEARTGGLAARIASTKEEYKRAAVVISVDQLVGVESKLLEAGYKYVSDCA